VALDTRITEELAGEGMARDVVRHIQDQRKEAGLEMEDRIALYLGTESEKLRRAIETHKAYIAGETLTVEWSVQPLTGPGVHRATVKVEGQTLTIELKKVTAKL
jgi:isoleucyl-tRNA synthetase